MFSKENFLPKFIFLSFLLVFFTGYYFTILSASEHSSILRFLIGFGLFYLAFYFRRDFKSITFFKVDSLLKVVFFVYIFYLLSLSFYYADWKSIRRILYIFLFVFFIYSYCKDLSLKIDRLIVVVPFLAGVIGFLYLYTYYQINGLTIHHKKTAISSTQFELLTDYGNPITAGLYLSFLVPFCLWSYFFEKNRYLSVFYYFSFYLILAAIFLTFARTAWLASAVSIFVFLIYALVYNKIKKMFLLILPLLLVSVYYLVNFLSYDMSRGVRYRDQIWVEFISSIVGLKQWLFGKGLSAPVDFVKLPWGNFAVHSHSIYVETLYLTGLIGLFLMCSLLVLSLYGLFKNIKDNQSLLWFSVLASLSVAMFFDYSNLIYSPNVMWLWFWFPVSIAVVCSSVNKIKSNSI